VKLHACIGVLVAGLFLVACKDEAKPGGATSASAGASASAKKSAEPPKPKPTGPAPESEVKPDDSKSAEEACTALVKQLETCISKAPADGKGELQEALKAHNEAWKAADPVQKSQMAGECNMQAATLRQDPSCQ
jgi:hypothetical protein